MTGPVVVIAIAFVLLWAAVAGKDAQLIAFFGGKPVSTVNGAPAAPPSLADATTAGAQASAIATSVGTLGPIGALVTVGGQSIANWIRAALPASMGGTK